MVGRPTSKMVISMDNTIRDFESNASNKSLNFSLSVDICHNLKLFIL